ncbi:hypothetical protein QBC36DRAFT_291002 [Triangularia setosa]|uniref:Uncharacterized protein n=1 Tax=Triangularia setosa TaxID=2587417 RepID=A0AAN6W5R0_9PEZI|nr:hypothetical protein QBC36DRAFT_291002 [Podospora setosa]
MSDSGGGHDAESGDNTIIIGIDFGTTFSGLAYTWSNNKTVVEVIGLYLLRLLNHTTQRIIETMGRAK